MPKKRIDVSKPVIFFSHSSRDSATLQRLKKAVLEKVGGAVDIFLSSDGQSIRLGRNWVSEIEEALNSSRLMFVFLSPFSVTSQWVYFEAGFSYSRNIEVVPVGINGVDLSTVSPPISLLQGFNITGHGSLNNIISAINDKLGHTHKLAFAEEDYEEIFAPVKKVRAVAVDYFGWVEAILVDTRLPARELLESVEAACRNHGLDVQASEFEVLTYGARYGKPVYQMQGAGERNERLQAEIAPEAAELHFQLIREMLSNVPHEVPKLVVTYYLSQRVDCVRPNNRLTAKLRGSEIRLGSQYNYLFRGSLFWLQYGYDSSGLDDLQGERVRIEVNTAPPDLPGIDVAELLRVLFQVGVLFAR